METSDGRSVMRKRMLLYSMSDGAGLMSFCFMMTKLVSCQPNKGEHVSTPGAISWYHNTPQTSEIDVTVRHSPTGKLSLYFHTTHDSLVAFVLKGSNYIIGTTRMDVVFNHSYAFEWGQIKVQYVEWNEKYSYEKNISFFFLFRHTNFGNWFAPINNRFRI